MPCYKCALCLLRGLGLFRQALRASVLTAGRVAWPLCLWSERDETESRNPAGVAAGRGFICFAAQFTANDRAPAGRDTIEPLGLHMCGWAKDNRRCSWNSQTGYKIASRIQRKGKKPRVLRKEMARRRISGGSGLLPLKSSRGSGNPRACLQGTAALPPQAGFL